MAAAAPAAVSGDAPFGCRANAHATPITHVCGSFPLSVCVSVCARKNLRRCAVERTRIKDAAAAAAPPAAAASAAVDEGE